MDDASKGARFGVYVHFPFCRTRCPYCDFATQARAELPHEAYAAAVLAELRARAADYAGRLLGSVYFGGGTPGLWRADRVLAVLDAVLAAFPRLGGGPEVTLEANPGDLAPAHYERLRRGGVNRLSLGMQSLNDDELRLLGRRHGRAEALAAVAAARVAGFDNLACDLMFALPGQTLERFRATLDEAVELSAEHLSVYNLTVEDGTPFAERQRRGLMRLPDQGLQVEMFELARERLGAAGYAHYEVSNFARPGREARHNTLYWQGDEYLGLGAAAHSFRRCRGGGPEVAERTANPTDPEAYMAATRAGTLAPASREPLDDETLRRDGLWLGLRLLAGISRADYRARHGVDPMNVAPEACVDLARQGLLAIDAARLRLTHRGLLFADDVAQRFV